MSLRLRFSILILGLVLVHIPAHAFEYRDRTLTEYVLTAEEFTDLNLDQRVAYLKFFINFIVTVEEMEDFPVAEKTAMVEHMQRYLAVFSSIADAEEKYVKDDSILGKLCIHTLTESHYIKSGNRYVCAPPEDTSNACAPKKLCPTALTSLVGLGTVCAPASTAAEINHLTGYCVKMIADKKDTSLDQKLADHAHGMNKGDLESMDKRASKMKQDLKVLETQLASYCAGGNAVNEGRQKEECGQIQHLGEVFHVITTLKADPFPENALAPAKVTAEHKKALASTPKRSIGALERQRLLADGKAVPDDPIVPRVVDKNKRVGDKLGDKTKEPDPVPPEPEITPPPAKEKPKKIAKESDCKSRYKKLGSLACVGRGLCDVSEAELRHGGGVSKWISLLGVMAQTYYGPYKTSDKQSEMAYRQQVIDMVASYGYCTDEEYPNERGVAKSNGDANPDWLSGKTRIQTNWNSNGEQEQHFAASFGLMSQYKNSNGKPQNHKRPVCYAKEIFDDNNGNNNDFARISIQQRQARFQSMVKAHRANFPNTGFGQCAEAIEGRIKRNPFFQMCQPIKKKYLLDYLRSPTISDQEIANNDRLYEAMAKECGLPLKRKIVRRTCDHGCWTSNVYDRSTRLPGCGHEPDPHDPHSPPDRPETGDHPRTPPGGDRPETGDHGRPNDSSPPDQGKGGETAPSAR